jgi:hypothetical protein
MLAAAMLMIGATVASADWKTVAEITAGAKPEARELALNRTIRTVQFEGLEGTVIVTTLWVREGAAKTEYTVSRAIPKGEKWNVDLGQDRAATGFRVSDQGPGRYKIHAK